MVFSQLRINNQVYVLHKDAPPTAEVGCVVNVTAPMPKFNSIQPGQSINYTVDVTLRIGDQTFVYQGLPANGEVADFAANGNVLLSCTREGLNAEVDAMRQRSADAISEQSITYHKNVVAACDAIHEKFNPETAQQKELEYLRGEVTELRALIRELKGERPLAED